jgi:hypothetical protein
MTGLRLLVLSLVLACSLGHANMAAQDCPPLGPIQFICGVVSPEDFAIVPRSDWLIVSGNRAGQGAIRAVNVRTHAVAPLFPSPGMKIRPDPAKFPGCPGPIDPADPTEKTRFAAHGLYLARGAATVHVLYVVHHGSRESIEVFEIDAGSTPPALTWTGCIVGPPNGTFNAVVALPEGGVAATTVTRTSGQGSPNGSGAVWEWHLGRGWTMVPGSEADRINGLEISVDGKWLYVSAWGDQALIRLLRGQVPAKRDVLQMPFRIDNLRLMSDGSILAAGHGGNALCSCPEETWHVGRIDPKAMTVQEILRRPYVEGFGAATVAIEVGKEIWIGTNRGDRIGRFLRANP